MHFVGASEVSNRNRKGRKRRREGLLIGGALRGSSGSSGTSGSSRSSRTSRMWILMASLAILAQILSMCGSVAGKKMCLFFLVAFWKV